MRDRGGRKVKYKVALKYCGGCNPTYDRMGAVREIERSSGGAISFVDPDTSDFDFVLVVCGCSVECADVRRFSKMRIIRISSYDDARSLADRIGRGDLDL